MSAGGLFAASGRGRARQGLAFVVAAPVAGGKVAAAHGGRLENSTLTEAGSASRGSGAFRFFMPPLIGQAAKTLDLDQGNDIRGSARAVKRACAVVTSCYQRSEM